MRIKFRSEKLPCAQCARAGLCGGTLLAEAHENDPKRHILLVAMTELIDGSWGKLVYLRPDQVIERIPEEGDEGYQNPAVTYCRQKLIAHWKEEKSDG